jgi:glycosyltransferase involved in cell wall biosynthesis
MEKKKVLFITPSLCQGGIERSQIIMLQLLDKSKYDLTLFMYGSDMTLLPLVPSEVRVVIDKDKPHYFRRPKAILLNGATKLFRHIDQRKKADEYQERLRVYIHGQKARHPAEAFFRNEQFDVVVSNAIGICTEMALYIQARKYIVWYRASVDMHHSMLSKAFPQYDYIMAVSEGVKDMLSANYPEIKKKIIVLQDFIFANEILEKSKEIYNITIKKDTCILCSCGRFTREKGFDMAVEAAKLLKEKGFCFVWYFVGDGADRSKLEKQISILGLQEDIVITGFVDNPFPIMKQCDIYIQPSYEEAFGRTIKEALILGKKIVSTNTAGGREILGNNQYGLITTIDAQGLADGIMAVQSMELEAYTMNDNRKEMQRFIDALNRYLS